jgi:predicted branched-subunit amino acid permease
MSGPAPSAPRKALLRGMLASAPFLVVVVPFALLFGVVATEAGLDIVQVLAFSLAVFAGASQFTALQLMQDQAPVVIVLATSLAVNLRMGMYSAALTPHLGALPLGRRTLVSFFLVDQSYAASAAEFERRPTLPLPDKLAFFAGTVLLVAPLWYIATWAGAVLGTRIPPEYALDFAVPITFISMLGPMLRTWAHVAAALTSVVAALAFSFMPYGSGLLVAAVLAMLTGALVELWQERRP